MADKFETQLVEKIARSGDCASFRFARPSGFDYVAGQFHFVTLPADGAMRKPFSFSSSPTEDFLETTTRLSGSEFKNALNALPVGGTVTMEAPYGQFTLREGEPKLAFLLGGIGITPVRGIVKYAADTELDVDMVLLYGNREEEGIVFRDDLDAISSQYAGLRVVYCVSDPSEEWGGCRGRIGEETIEAHVPDPTERLFYACGPPAMVGAMKELLSGLGIGVARVVLEQFGGY